jgi:CRISPR/Cas system-associated protein Cas7 (RAMP superfamily)
LAAASLDRRDVGKREGLVPFVSIVCYPCVVELRDEHYDTQHYKENPYFRKEKTRVKQASGTTNDIEKVSYVIIMRQGQGVVDELHLFKRSV